MRAVTGYSSNWALPNPHYWAEVCWVQSVPAGANVPLLASGGTSIHVLLRLLKVWCVEVSGI